MNLHQGKIRTLVLTLGYLALAHFAIGLYHAFSLALFTDAHGTYFWFSVPYIAITGIFVAGVIFAHMRCLRWAAFMVVFGLLISIGAFVYDVSNHRYQFHVTGDAAVHGPVYVIWWWYDESFWQGYEAGNL